MFKNQTQSSASNQDWFSSCFTSRTCFFVLGWSQNIPPSVNDTLQTKNMHTFKFSGSVQTVCTNIKMKDAWIWNVSKHASVLHLFSFHSSKNWTFTLKILFKQFISFAKQELEVTTCMFRGMSTCGDVINTCCSKYDVISSVCAKWLQLEHTSVEIYEHKNWKSAD